MSKRAKAPDLQEIDDYVETLLAEELARKVLDKEDKKSRTMPLSDVIVITAGLAVGAGICVLLDNRDLKKRIRELEKIKKEG